MACAWIGIGLSEGRGDYLKGQAVPNKEFGRDYARGRCDTVESNAGTRWKEDLTGGPHLSMTQGRGTCLSVEEVRGRDAGCEGKNWATAPARAGPRGRTGGRLWAFGPISR